MYFMNSWFPFLFWLNVNALYAEAGVSGGRAGWKRGALSPGLQGHVLLGKPGVGAASVLTVVL